MMAAHYWHLHDFNGMQPRYRRLPRISPIIRSRCFFATPPICTGDASPTHDSAHALDFAVFRIIFYAALSSPRFTADYLILLMGLPADVMITSCLSSLPPASAALLPFMAPGRYVARRLPLRASVLRWKTHSDTHEIPQHFPRHRQRLCQPLGRFSAISVSASLAPSRALLKIFDVPLRQQHNASAISGLAPADELSMLRPPVDGL